MDQTDAELLWSPPADVWATSRLGLFVAAHRPEAVGDYEALWRWSVEDLPGFWQAVSDFFDLQSSTPVDEALSDPSMPGASWFDGARVNYAAHMLRGNGLADGDVAVVAESQTRASVTWSLGELREQVHRAAAGLRRLGVGQGDRVGAYLPNVPEALVAFLATASLGAIWSSCAPEFGTRSVVDRWSQILPSVLLTVDGYRYGAKAIDRTGEVAEIRAALPSIQHTVLLGYLDPDVSWDGCVGWDELVADTDAPATFVDVAFDHPLYVLYSSGTTGLPKPIVHGHGGILVEHAKSLALHLDLGPGDRFFWFSTTGWMMWSYLVSGLLVGSAIVLFDGNPGHPDLDTLWSLAERTGTTYMGVSAPFLISCYKEGLTPGTDHDLTGVRAMGSTGAPLPADGFRWVYEAVGDHLQLGSVSGGTDVCTAFVGSTPVLPVYAGVIPCRMLGCRVEAYDDDAQPVIGTRGELVITAPMPSMPVAFWGDDDGARYRDAYFDTFPGVWRHGDWITIHDDGSCVITGRSDATLNRGGVRLGTAEFYAVVESLPEVADSLVVHLEDDTGGMGELVLFVACREGHDLDEDLRGRITSALRAQLSARHVPDTMVLVPAVPRTLSGKKLEVPVKRILGGTPPEEAASKSVLADPDALAPYVDWAKDAFR
ncbi:acetoacetate--CoA ligase [Nitriliruptor alkaliphilus]|uniref:acetoacetate--CoA ligase n=1 Tax=Nitriliruptor alkaliphilus TaxID=427918 RepID=UPI0006963567|nr:acetoacetate--CoA ligase [Nitriliruptor alkaliphilus]